MQNKRQNSRIHFKTTVNIKTNEVSFLNLKSQDLSLKGIQVLGIEGLNVDDICDTEIILSGLTSNLSFHIKSKVIRVEKRSAALKFIEIDLDSYFHLKNIISYNVGNYEEIDKESFME